jgi:hypothetical protein
MVDTAPTTATSPAAIDDHHREMIHHHVSDLILSRRLASYVPRFVPSMWSSPPVHLGRRRHHDGDVDHTEPYK